jgi:hypothetical protein
MEKGKSKREKGISRLDKGISLPDLVISAVDLPQWKPQKGMSRVGNPAPEREISTSQPDQGISARDKPPSQPDQGKPGCEEELAPVEKEMNESSGMKAYLLLRSLSAP